MPWRTGDAAAGVGACAAHIEIFDRAAIAAMAQHRDRDRDHDERPSPPDRTRSEESRHLSDAVRRMLPKNRLARVMLSHLEVYPGAAPETAPKNGIPIKVPASK